MPLHLKEQLNLEVIKKMPAQFNNNSVNKAKLQRIKNKLY